MSLPQADFWRKKRTARRARCLPEMKKVMPWPEALGVIEPRYLTGKRGFAPPGLERMLRGYLVQQ